jgi:membrane-associated protease RseP (regulator of RpoE activity)
VETAVIAAPKIELSSIEAPHIAPEIVEGKLFPSENAPGESAPDQEEKVAGPAADNPPPSHVNRFTMLAACLALAAAFGGMLGALAAYGFVRPGPSPVIAAAKFGSEEIQALKENVVQVRVELAALKASVDAGNRVATTQLTKIAERIERSERNAAEPAAKINKAVESLERIARTEGAASPKDATGSITPPQPAAGKPAAVEGWVLRDVHRGTAFIEGRAGVIEVEQGDLVPGLGRIEAIRKQDGRWVVVTSKGTITAPR